MAVAEESPSPHPDVDAMLAQLTVRGRAAIEVMERPASVTTKLVAPKLRYSHEAMVDLILENPWISQNDVAAHFGRAPAWISTIITSDAFKAQYEARRAELLDPELRLTLQERFQALTVKSLQVLQEKLSRPADQIPDQLALRAAELGAKSLGLGQPTSTVVLTSEDKLASLAHRLIALRSTPQQEIIDVTSREVA